MQSCNMKTEKGEGQKRARESERGQRGGHREAKREQQTALRQCMCPYLDDLIQRAASFSHHRPHTLIGYSHDDCGGGLLAAGAGEEATAAPHRAEHNRQFRNLFEMTEKQI